MAKYASISTKVHAIKPSQLYMYMLWYLLKRACKKMELTGAVKRFQPF